MLWEHLVQVQLTSTHLDDYICTHLYKQSDPRGLALYIP